MAHVSSHRASRLHQKVMKVNGEEKVVIVDETGQPVFESAHVGHSEGGGGAPPTTSTGMTMDQMFDALVALQGMITATQEDLDSYKGAMSSAVTSEIEGIKTRLDALEAG